MLFRCSVNLSYQFKNKETLKQALTHRSFSPQHYERLEFLGDSILGAAIADILFTINPNAQEGDLTKVRSSIVNEKTLSEVATSLELHRHIIVGKSGEKDEVYTNQSVLADVLEAIIGAIYLDGGFEAAYQFVRTTFEKTITSPPSFRDYKSELQTIAQHRFKSNPRYSLEHAVGPEHKKVFTVTVDLNRNILGWGQGNSKKAAEQEAAKAAIVSLST